MIAVFRHHVSTFGLMKVLSDMTLAFAGVLLGFWTVSAVRGSGLSDGRSTIEMLEIALAFALLMSLTSACFGLYRRSRTSKASRTARMLLALPIGGGFAYLAVRLFADHEYAAMLTATALAYLGVGLLVFRTASRYLRRWTQPSRILIVGTGPEALTLAHELEGQKRIGGEVIGFYPTTSSTQDADPGFPHRVFARDVKLVDLVARHEVREVIVAVTEHRGGGVPMEQLLACRTLGVRVLDLAGFYERLKSEVPIQSLKASWLVYGQGFVQGRMRRWIKRTFDIVCAGVLLLATLPIMAIAMVLIAIDSPGPVLYRQERVGCRGRAFTCLKLRSMRIDAEGDGVARWATSDDDRITRVGGFIRKTRIDELPQLISVLRGEMSLVGPRPERPSFVRELTDQIPFYDIRHSIKPGLTGWAQVRYCYGSTLEDAKRKHQFDLYYVKNNSLFLDLMILIETVSVVLLREGQ